MPIPPPPAPSGPSGDRGGDAASPRRPTALDHVLLEAARQLASSLEPDALFARLRESVCGAMRCDGLIVSSLDRDAAQIRCEYAWVGGNVLDPATLPPLAYDPAGGGMQSEVIRTGRPTRFDDVAERVRDPHGTYYEVDPEGGIRDLREGPPPKARSAVMVPLRLEGEVVGAVQVMADAAGVYTEADLELLEGVSLILAVALENTRLFRRAQDELEERRRTEAELRAAEEALRNIDRRKDEFLATLGHELRNPLDPIRNAVELLRRMEGGDPEERRAHQMIERQVVHLTRLIDDLMDVGRITHGKLELRRGPVDLHAVLDGAIDGIRPATERAGQRLTVEWTGEPVRVDADPVRLAQVFSNLLDNAVKYTPRGGSIAVSVERHGGEVRVAVRDDGIGIDPAALPSIFDLFYQADRSLGRAHTGLGIGLTMVRRLVEMHGGTVAAHSEGRGRGTEFEVRLPVLAAAPAPGGESRSQHAPAARPRRILIADDNQDSADSMAMLLRMSGNEVAIAYDGEEAVRMAGGFQPDVLLLDLGMPRLDGYQVAQRLRSEPWGRDVVLIAATGWGQEEDRRRSLETGFDAHVVKPVDHDALLRLLGELNPGDGRR